MPPKCSSSRSVIPVACQAAIILLLSMASSAAAGDGSAKLGKAAISTNTVLPIPQVFVEGTVLYAEANAPHEVSALTQGMVSYVRSFPPASEPALVDLLVLLGGGGSPPFVISGGPVGRGWGINSSLDPGPIAGLAAVHGYEGMSILSMSPIVLDVFGTADPGQMSGVAAPHPYSLDTSRTAVFDIDGDGYAELAEWVGPDIGLLVFPSGPGAVISGPGGWTWVGEISGRDLIGTVGGYRNGFEHLQAFDLDHNMRVNSDELSPFFIWIDANGNGVPDTGELSKPAELSIAELVIPESGSEGSFSRVNETTGAMWDWWPSYAPLRPNPGKKSTGKTAYWEPVELTGVLETVADADLVTTVEQAAVGGREMITIESLSGLGFNTRESLLACLDPDGVHVACVDYRPDPPHTGRVWIMYRGTGPTWHVHRFPIPEDDIDQVTFDDAGGQALVMARGQSQGYILAGWDQGNGQVFRLAWQEKSFRGCWGSAFADHSEGAPVSGRYYVPGYFHLANGNPVCDAVALLAITGNSAAMTPVSDIHALAGEYLPSLETGLEPASSYFLKSPGLSFALARNAEHSISLLAISAGAPEDWHAEGIDRAASIAGLSASGTRVEYLAQRQSGQWEICWADVSGAKSHQVFLAYGGRPSYPELADSGTRPLWMEFDWTTGKASLHMAKVVDRVTQAPLLTDIPIPGPMRVAEAAPVYVVQTEAGFIVGGAYLWWEGPGVPTFGGIGLIVLLIGFCVLGGKTLCRWEG